MSSLIFKHAAHILGRPPIIRVLPVHAKRATGPGSICKVQYMSIFHVHPRISERTANVEWAKMSKEAIRSDETPANPYSGRSVKVINGNVVDAFKRLDSVLVRNKVRAQARQSERHEQKGAKRRRLSSERWRKRFAHEVRLKVQLVQKIRRRGA